MGTVTQLPADQRAIVGLLLSAIVFVVGQDAPKSRLTKLAILSYLAHRTKADWTVRAKREEIASVLGIDVRTVSNHLNGSAKLGTTGIFQLGILNRDDRDIPFEYRWNRTRVEQIYTGQEAISAQSPASGLIAVQPASVVVPTPSVSVDEAFRISWRRHYLAVFRRHGKPTTRIHGECGEAGWCDLVEQVQAEPELAAAPVDDVARPSLIAYSQLTDPELRTTRPEYPLSYLPKRFPRIVDKVVAHLQRKRAQASLPFNERAPTFNEPAASVFTPSSDGDDFQAILARAAAARLRAAGGAT